MFLSVSEYSNKITVKKCCKKCGKWFIVRHSRHQFCSTECGMQCLGGYISRIPNKLELQQLLWEIPSSKIAKIYEVSDTAVKKWARKYGLSKPPRGYWAKKYSGDSK